MNTPGENDPSAGQQMMDDYVAVVQSHIAQRLDDAAIGYLHIGVSAYRKHSSLHPPYAQLIVGNLAIAIELMLKSLVARHSLLLLFKSA